MSDGVKQTGQSPRSGVSVAESVWWRLKTLEYAALPMRVRRRLLPVVMPDPFAGRSGVLADGREAFFLHVPKTGGTSVASALGLRQGHIPVSRYLARDAARYEAGFSFAFVRNPWDRLFSAFSYLHGGIGYNDQRDARWAGVHLARFADFEEFVLALRDGATRRRIWQWSHFRPQTDWLCLPGNDTISVTRLARFERIAEDTAELGKAFGLKDVDLPVTRKTKMPGRRYFSAEMIRIIADLYARDVRLLGYDAPTPSLKGA